MTTTGTSAAPRRKRNEDQPLIDDIRLLGRILGDVIREQEGKEIGRASCRERVYSSV